ncbi:NRDE family protein [Salinirubellus sp. GCM10025818]|uniref:NRDE family protein n=1 Tax=Salinirubellus TaxID=2162630 RepID=UPI0030D209B9
MCTLIVAWQVFEDTPVAVVANRDELYARESRSPAVESSEIRIVAPRDEEAGGTWVGYNEDGVTVAITNRWIESPDGERSRGLLVRDALHHRSAEDAARFVERELVEREYGPFHLLIADADAALLLAWNGVGNGPVHFENLTPGVHTVVNVGWDGSYFVPERRPEIGRKQAEDTERVREAIRPDPGELATAWTDRARAVLADHDYGRCIHGDGFGTKSASVIRLGPEGGVFEHAEGPPCETPFEAVEAPF